MNILQAVFAAALTLALGTGALYAGNGIDLRTLDGEATTLSEHFDQGKWTLVMVWSAYCSSCRQQYPGISAFHDRHEGADAKVLGISVDDYEQRDYIRHYAATSPMSFDSLIGDARAVQDLYRAATDRTLVTPTYMLFDPTGMLVAHHDGPLSVETIESYIRDNSR